MVDAVSMISMSNATQGSRSQGAPSSDVPVASPPAEEDFVSSYIRVDNLQNVAILEYRSSRTGEVVQQYPTQTQIAAFKRAESIEAKRQQEAAASRQVTVAPSPPVETAAPAPAQTSDSSTTSVLV